MPAGLSSLRRILKRAVNGFVAPIRRLTSIYHDYEYNVVDDGW
jgi:hypothetical protein